MKYTLGFVVATVCSFSVFASDIAISSFRRLEPQNMRNTGAEVCGRVLVPLKGGEKIHVVVDPRTNPGDYIVLISPNGKWCHVVATYEGRLEASLLTTNGFAAEKAVKAKLSH